MANGHGGARPNSGRKRKSEIYAVEIESAERRIARKLDDYIANLEKLAKGGIPTKRVINPVSGKPVVVEKSLPCRASNEYLINRVMSKPAQEVDVTSNGETIGSGLFTGFSDDELERLHQEADRGGTPSPEVSDPA